MALIEEILDIYVLYKNINLKLNCKAKTVHIMTEELYKISPQKNIYSKITTS